MVSLGEEVETHPRCGKARKEVGKAGSVDPTATGSKENNLLIKLLRCQEKHDRGVKDCQKWMSQHDECFKSVMGVGGFEGEKNCAKQLEAWFQCQLGR